MGLLVRDTYLSAITHGDIGMHRAKPLKEKNMDMQEVKSSLISAVGYQDEELFVRFKTTKRLYKYEDVPRAVFNELLAAPSIGRYFLQKIKGAYTPEKIEETTPGQEKSAS